MHQYLGGLRNAKRGGLAYSPRNAPWVISCKETGRVVSVQARETAPLGRAGVAVAWAWGLRGSSSS